MRCVVYIHIYIKYSHETVSEEAKYEHFEQTLRENEMFRCRLQGQSQLCCNHTSGSVLAQYYLKRLALHAQATHTSRVKLKTCVFGAARYNDDDADQPSHHNLIVNLV